MQPPPLLPSSPYYVCIVNMVLSVARIPSEELEECPLFTGGLESMSESHGGQFPLFRVKFHLTFPWPCTGPHRSKTRKIYNGWNTFFSRFSHVEHVFCPTSLTMPLWGFAEKSYTKTFSCPPGHFWDCTHFAPVSPIREKGAGNSMVSHYIRLECVNLKGSQASEHSIGSLSLSLHCPLLGPKQQCATAIASGTFHNYLLHRKHTILFLLIPLVH